MKELLPLPPLAAAPPATPPASQVSFFFFFFFDSSFASPLMLSPPLEFDERLAPSRFVERPEEWKPGLLLPDPALDNRAGGRADARVVVDRVESCELRFRYDVFQLELLDSAAVRN